MAAIVSIFSPQIETIVFIVLQIFFATRAVLKIDTDWVHVSTAMLTKCVGEGIGRTY